MQDRSDGDPSYNGNLLEGNAEQTFNQSHVSEDSEDDSDFDPEGEVDDIYEMSTEEDMSQDEFIMDTRISMRQNSLLNGFQLLRDHVPSPLENELSAELKVRTEALQPRALKSTMKLKCINPASWIALRENCATKAIHFSTFYRLPRRPTRRVDLMNSRAYIGQFTADGSMFVGAFQNERRIRIYDSYDNFNLKKDIHARNLRWTVTDTSLSKDQQYLIYSSISPVVHLVNTSYSEEIESVANVTDIHEALNFVCDSHQASGIWSIKWSADSREIIAGTGDASLYVYDISAGKAVARVQGHDDDVNAVAYLDENMIATGSDDTLINVYDRRLIGGRRTSAVGVFLGHLEGITHMDSKGDGRYMISTSKDQSIKLWDVRSMLTSAQARKHQRAKPINFSWDYRWMNWPGHSHVINHPHDCSLATYRGLTVVSTLIRSYFSPLMTTGQKYLYAGSGDGKVRIWDVVTQQVVETLHYHKEVVRDCSWHPYLPMLASACFDGSVVVWEPETPGDVEARGDEAYSKAERIQPGTGAAAAQQAMRVQLPRPGTDMLGDYF